MHIVLQYTFVIFIVISSYLNQSYLSSCVSYIVYILVQLSNKEKYTENIFFPSSTLPCLTNLSKMITLCQFSKMITIVSIFQNVYIVSILYISENLFTLLDIDYSNAVVYVMPFLIGPFQIFANINYMIDAVSLHAFCKVA